MRKTNHVPWMGRAVLVAIMAFVCFGVLAGQARAQVDLQDYMGWWDRWTGDAGCTAMLNVVNILEINYFDATTRTPGGTTHVAATKAADGSRWCVPWSGLSTASTSNDAKNLKDAVTMGQAGTNATDAITKKASDNIFNVQGYWTSINAGTNAVMTRRLILGLAVAAADPGATYSSLPRATANAVDAAYMALMPGMMTDSGDDDDMDDAPALPLVGVGLLGLLLAGRGAWLRRRA